MYGGEGSSEDNLVVMASALGVKNAAAQMNDNSNKAVKRVDADLALAHRLGLHSTPSIFLLCKGYFPEPVASSSVERLMDNVIEQERAPQERA